MDRGRSGGFVTDNNYVMVKFNEKKRREHLARLEKIKHRKPGTSHTLDNSPPVVVKAALTNPRKVALKETFNFITEQENKSLLKRISSILVAPPKITDKEYLEMKKLCPSSFKSPKMVFEESLVEKRNREFFENLKKTKPYYNPKDWEQDYKKQLFNQKFMRQVKYKRPPDFVDPLLPKLDSTSTDTKTKDLNTRSTTARDTKEPRCRSTASHVRRVRAQRTISNRRQQSAPRSSNENTQDEENYDDADFVEVGDPQNSKHSREYTDDLDYDHDSFFGDDDDSSARPEVRFSLARTQRLVRITRDEMVVGSTSDANDPNFFFAAEVECWLSNGESIIVRVIGQDGEQSVNAEAEIRRADLDLLVELPPNEKLNPKDLTELAQQIVENVEVHLEQSVYRLLLNLMTENDQVDANSAAVDWGTALPAICASEEELQTMLLQDNHELVLSIGVRLPVHFLVHPTGHGFSNFSSLVDVATLSAKVEHVFALVKFFSTKEDQLFVQVFIVNNTMSSFRKGLRTQPAVASEENLTITIPLPSVVLADPEIIIAFAENLTRSLRIEHDCKSGENKLLVLSS